jgi:hypothetical protein
MANKYEQSANPHPESEGKSAKRGMITALPSPLHTPKQIGVHSCTPIFRGVQVCTSFFPYTAKGVVLVTTPRVKVGWRRPIKDQSPGPILHQPGPPMHSPSVLMY